MDRCYSVLTIRAVDDDARIIRGIASTPDPDRMGDIVEPLGLKFANPTPLLWQHDHAAPVGTVKFDKPTKHGITFEARLAKISEPGRLKDRVDEAWQSVKAGLVRAVSIGFRALEHSRMEDGGIRFLKSELLELSLVTVPAQANATITEIRSIDRQLRAASGTAQEAVRKTPGVSGQSQPSIRGNKKMDIDAQIAELDTRRAEIVAEMKSFGDVTDLDDEQSAEYDSVSAELGEVDKKLARATSLKAALGTARPIDGGSREKGSEGRGRITVAAAPKVELPKGTLFARYAMSIMAGKGSLSDTLAYAKRFDSQTPEVTAHIKATTGTAADVSPGWGSELVYQNNLTGEFIDLLRAATVIGRINGFRMVPFNVRVAAQTAGAVVNWVGEGASKPVGENAYDEVTLGYNKIAGIVTFSEELLRLSSPNVETLVRNDLVGGITNFMDAQFLLSSITASSTRPASVTNGVTGAGASGTDADSLYYDLNVAMAAFDTANYSLGTLHFVTTPAIARGISTLRNAFGQMEFTGMTPNGGTLLGFPVIVSNSCPAGEIILINAGEILLADDGVVRLDSSNQATLDMDGGDSPDVNLWQKNLIGIRAERWITYKKARAGAVNRITSAAYGPTAPDEG